MSFILFQIGKGKTLEQSDSNVHRLFPFASHLAHHLSFTKWIKLVFSVACENAAPNVPLAIAVHSLLYRRSRCGSNGGSLSARRNPD